MFRAQQNAFDDAVGKLLQPEHSSWLLIVGQRKQRTKTSRQKIGSIYWYEMYLLRTLA